MVTITRNHVSLPLSQVFGVVSGYFFALISGVGALIAAPFRQDNGAPTVLRHVSYQAIRKLVQQLSITQLQWLLPGTDDVYAQFARNKGFRPSTTVTEAGVRGHWLGSQDAKNIIVYFHGGGYAIALDENCLSWLWKLFMSLKKAGSDVAIVILAYDITPHARYPTQLEQAVGLLKYVLQDLQKKPSETFLAGDSAGGNLTLAVLSHLVHPHPQIPPLSPPGPFAGAVLLCPWTNFNCMANAYYRNMYKDCIGIDHITKWGRAFLGDAKADAYNQPMTAPAGWFKGLPVEKMLVVGGGDEVMIDDIKATMKRIEARLL
ncbi:MAG: hypothetical protein M1838_002514 [Thelocarpon superellum]|nr:MAG: hypothetical protein M1838_002514 [Thelocarpon superellum]